MEKKFVATKLLKGQKYYKAGKQAIKALLSSEEIPVQEFIEFFDNEEECNEVLEENVFAYHPSRNKVTFQSQSTKNYILEKSNVFDVLIELDNMDGFNLADDTNEFNSNEASTSK